MPNTTDYGIAISGSSSGSLGTVVRLGPRSQAITDVRQTGIADADEKYLPGDVTEHGEQEVEIFFDSGSAYPTIGTSETWTITHKLNSGETVAATYAGTGYIKSVSDAERSRNPSDAVTQTVVIKWDGSTPPAFTAAT